MKLGYEIGYPLHCQYSLKPTLSFYYLPKFLAELCFYQNDFKTGLDCSILFLEKYNLIKDKIQDLSDIELYTMKCWNKIYYNIIAMQNEI